MREIFGLILTIALFSVVGTGGVSVHAAAFTVDSTDDAVDAAPGDGVCATATDSCTLRAAIQETNELEGPDTITLSPGTYTLTLAGSDENSAASGDLDVRESLTIMGAGADTTVIDAGGLDRVIEVHQGPRTNGLQLSDLTIQGGVVPENSGGGGIKVDAGALVLQNVIVQQNQAGASGGGIVVGFTAEPVTLDAVELRNNVASGSGGGLDATVGVTIRDSIIVGNTAQQGGGLRIGDNDLMIERSVVADNVAAQAGAILLFRSGAMNAVNLTVSGNRADHPLNVAGIMLDGEGHTLVHVTIAENLVGIGLSGFAGGATVRDSIIAGNAGGDCQVSSVGLTIAGNNVDSDGSCGFNLTADAGLAPLAYWGGPSGMLTHALGSSSPAIDAAAACGAPVDQRGEPRPQADACDLGAYEATPAMAQETAFAGGFNSLGWVGGVASVEEAFADVLDQLDGVWAWDAPAQQFLTWRPSLPPALNTLKTLAPGTGLWIRLRDGGDASVPTLAAGDAFVTGDAFGAVVVPSDRLAPGGVCIAPERTLETGFNLVTWSGGSATPSAALVSLGANLQGVWQWDNDADAYLTYNPALPESLNSLETIQPGISLWVRVTATTVLTGLAAC